MIRIETNIAGGRLSLGQFLEIELHREGGVEICLFLKHKPVFYLKPLTPWQELDHFKLLPESVGDFALLAAWRSADGISGWHEPIDFEVTHPKSTSPSPFKIRTSRRTFLWAPSEWEAIVTALGEKPTQKAIRHLVRPGFVVYDIGASLGKYAIPMARLSGPEGYVYCFEANPVCVQYLRSNLIGNRVTNAEILPVAVLDREGESRFTINYGNVSLGLTAEGHFYPGKAGQEIEVHTAALDDLIVTFCLRPPDLIKMDIEGAERLAVQGMRKTLEVHRPILVLELHGAACSSITLALLDSFDYVYQDPGAGTPFSSRDEVCAHHDEGAVFQLVARPAEDVGPSS